MKRLLVGMDDSPASADALRWAAELARALDADVVAVSAFQPPYAEVRPADYERMHEQRRHELEDDWIAGAEPAQPVRAMVVDGDPRDTLLGAAESERADLLVVGAVAEGTGPDFLYFGTFDEFLLHHASMPLAVVPQYATSPPKRILVGVDGSVANEAAVRWAADVSQRAGAPVTAVAVFDENLKRACDVDAVDEDGARHSTEALVDAWTAPIAGVGAAIDTRVLDDVSPAQGLLEAAAAEHADVVVLGAQGVGALTGVRIGGVAIDVVHHARVPVVVVPVGWHDRAI